MSTLKGQVGSFAIEWHAVPRGSQGQGSLTIAGERVDVRWHRDEQGIWVEFPDGLRGYDIQVELDDEGKRSFKMRERGGTGEWQGVGFLRAGEASLSQAGGAKKKGLRVRAQMPGKIVRVLVKAGQTVEKQQSLLVMEAMKMENEIRAAAAGTIKEVKVSEGQAVESGADLILLEND